MVTVGNIASAAGAGTSIVLSSSNLILGYSPGQWEVIGIVGGLSIGFLGAISAIISRVLTYMDKRRYHRKQLRMRLEEVLKHVDSPEAKRELRHEIQDKCQPK